MRRTTLALPLLISATALGAVRLRLNGQWFHHRFGAATLPLTCTARHAGSRRTEMLRRLLARIGIAMALVVSTPFAGSSWIALADSQIERGEYLVSIMDCTGCHTPGSLAGDPDLELYLAGSTIGFQIPGLGVFYPPNLTPDLDTGLGKWSDAEIMLAVRGGTRPDGRELAPIMPWRSYAALSDEDAQAVTAFLKSLPAVKFRSPGPFSEGETPSDPYLTVVVPK